METSTFISHNAFPGEHEGLLVEYLFAPNETSKRPLQLSTSTSALASSNTAFFYPGGGNTVSAIPPGFRLGGTPVVPSSPITAVPLIPLPSTPTVNHAIHPLLVDRSNDFIVFSSNHSNNGNPFDLFESQNLASQQFIVEQDLMSGAATTSTTSYNETSRPSSSTTTPALTFHTSPRLESVFFPNALSFNNCTLLSSSGATYVDCPTKYKPRSPMLPPNNQPQYHHKFIPTPPPSDRPSSTNSSSSNNNTNSDSKKRTRLSTEQREYMLQVFEENNQPNTKALKEVAEKIGTSLRHVQFWFQNRRAAMRRRKGGNLNGESAAVATGFRKGFSESPEGSGFDSE
ncbi:hypothetical protein BDR26DRAFT_977966 [Obelidium mucronatum]|nr:hypothetical protein BDR26DRAFT_977966 [Obelidium mucronatum]